MQDVCRTPVPDTAPRWNGMMESMDVASVRARSTVVLQTKSPKSQKSDLTTPRTSFTVYDWLYVAACATSAKKKCAHPGAHISHAGHARLLALIRSSLIPPAHEAIPRFMTHKHVIYLIVSCVTLTASTLDKALSQQQSLGSSNRLEQVPNCLRPPGRWGEEGGRWRTIYCPWREGGI